ncbi:porin family protein [Candidatus Colwellia aromaticivorans]|uniref:porin family protein n=1 Tax=Candidatus Colwellia aromaticivorans TaxID=2267621 RepID=UPI001FE28934|nr:porin family protein [Candidatus Colwellia aromaticivorans]
MALLVLSYSIDSQAKYTQRDGKWEASFITLNSLSSDISGENGSAVDIDSDIGWGFTLGYNVNPHVLVNFEFSSTSPKYDATLVSEDDNTYNIKHKMNIYNSQFNVVYNFMTEQFTPFVQAGAGWSYLDSNIADGPPNTICWWDPWWGYICEGYQNTHNDTRFSYNVAAGFRYELDNSIFFRASYQQNWITMSNSDDLSMGMVHLEIGSIF